GRREDGQRPVDLTRAQPEGLEVQRPVRHRAHPTNKAGQTVIAPLGGETMDMGAGGSTEQQKLAWEWVQGMQQPDVMTHVTSLMYYLPGKPAVTAQVLKGGPDYTLSAKESQTDRPRTTDDGPDYDTPP